MKIKWNGHASFTITSKDGKVIVTDPYEPGAFGGEVKYGKILDRPDIVTVSHGHPDHDHIKGLAGAFEVVRYSGTFRGINFKVVPTFHDEKKGSARGANKVIVFEVDGIKIAHLGDLGHALDDKQIAEMGPVDLLLIPTGGLFTIDAKAATSIVEKLSPKVVIPMHFKTPKLGFSVAPVDDFLKGKARVRREGKAEIELTKETLPKNTEVVVLEHAY